MQSLKAIQKYTISSQLSEFELDRPRSKLGKKKSLKNIDGEAIRTESQLKRRTK